MRIELKGFQDTAARRLYKYTQNARRDARDGELQALILSSPTGSGKTATVTQVMEWIYAGFESHAPDHEAIFLWVSDSPELNAQSRDKILRQSSVFREHQLVVIEPPFSREMFEAGRIYFLNTQKLSATSLLTKTGDGRDYTIWQTIQNTAYAKPDHFYVIIDEAHRGMMEKPRDRERATSIIQRFIKGAVDIGLQPVPLLIGMSATPERFNALLAGTERTVKPIIIDPEDVKSSGLLKHNIVLYHPQEQQATDWTLLQLAVQQWQDFWKEWEAYCHSQEMDRIVRPVLVIQVEDGSGDVLTRTNLDELVRTVEKVVGRLPERAWTHAFQEDKTFEHGNQKIRKLEASRINDDPDVRVAIFKMSLTTGWDCPRAEVMMSFRRAHDYTLIAQLVGRMVRTPLARSIEAQDFLNTVSLFLPHYDAMGLNAILGKLNNPDPETGLAVQVVSGDQLAVLHQAEDKADLFEVLKTLPTYHVEPVGRKSETRRLMRLARRLTMIDDIDATANRDAKQLIINTLHAELQRLRQDPAFIGNHTGDAEIEVYEVQVEYGEWKQLDNTKTLRIALSPQNIDALFDQCGRMLGEGLHMEFWKAYSTPNDPYRAKLELFGVLQEKTASDRLERACKKRIDELLAKHDTAISEKPTSAQEYYRRIKRIAKEPQPETMPLFKNIEVRSEGPHWSKHLFVDAEGKFGADLNDWETRTIAEELAKPEVVGWLRNVPRQQWALCVPYREGDRYKGLYPDFLVFRLVDGQIVVDILDPHTTSLADAPFKARGLADYAEKHGQQFGRIELIVKASHGVLRRLDLQQEAIRARVRGARDKPQLDRVFDELG